MGIVRVLVAFGYDRIKDQDLFEKFITLKYDGKDSFKSFFGGLVSTLIKIGLLFQFILLTITIINRGNTTKANK